jgi:hypothetical protein
MLKTETNENGITAFSIKQQFQTPDDDQIGLNM